VEAMISMSEDTDGRKGLSPVEREQIRFMLRYLVTVLVGVLLAAVIVGVVVTLIQ
jgi:hypothetical protein